MIALTLPWPHRFLSPNVSYTKHYMTMSPIKKAAKADAFRAARIWLNRKHDFGSVMHWAESVQFKLIATFYEPDNRCRDWDNLAGSLKHYQDGICEALGINDKRIRSVSLEYKVDKANPRVELTINAIK